MVASSSETATLLSNKPTKGVSKVSVILACLAVLALGAVMAVATRVNFGPNDREIALRQDLREAEAGVQQPVTPFCRGEVIDFQRSFVKGLEAFFANGCGGESFDPFSVRDEILQEKDAHSTGACEQDFMDKVFTKTFARVYGDMCTSAETSLNIILGLSTIGMAPADFTAYINDKITLAISSGEGMSQHYFNVVKVEAVTPATAALANSKKCTANDQNADIIMTFKVSAGTMAESLLAMAHIKEHSEQGLIIGTIQTQGIATIAGTVVLGWVPPPVPDHLDGFSNHVNALLGSAVTA
jgi:hypothetical protein